MSARSPGDHFNTNMPKDQEYGRQGLIWEDDELEKLRDLFMNNHCLADMTWLLQRPPGGVLPKLELLKLIRRSPSLNYGTPRYIYNVHVAQRPVEKVGYIPVTDSAMRGIELGSNTMPIEIQTTTKETTMSAPEIITIETKTFIAGTNAAELSDASIIKMIAELETKSERLRNIKASSTTIKALIDKHDADVLKLVQYLDERTAANDAKTTD